MNSQLLNFFKELANRFASKSPKFFQVLQVLFGSLTLAGYLPGVLSKYFNVELPTHLVALCHDIALVTTGAFASTLLPVKSPAIGTTDNATITVQTEKKLPYTVTHEKEKAEASDTNASS